MRYLEAGMAVAVRSVVIDAQAAEGPGSDGALVSWGRGAHEPRSIWAPGGPPQKGHPSSADAPHTGHSTTRPQTSPCRSHGSRVHTAEDICHSLRVRRPVLQSERRHEGPRGQPALHSAVQGREDGKEDLPPFSPLSWGQRPPQHGPR